MTSRSSLGTLRQPQRSISGGPAILQRPPPNRASSQQYKSSSAHSRKGETTGDKTGDAADPAHTRNPQPRLGGSKLKLELSKDPKQESSLPESSPSFIEQSVPVPALQVLPPPRGKPRLEWDAHLPQIDGSNSVPPPTSAREFEKSSATMPLPLPRRPGHQVRPTGKGKTTEVGTTPTKKDGRPKPYVLDVPSAAPRYTPNGHADFFPWTGNHPEDQFTENIIRSGYSDKLQPSQNETGSAKPVVFPALKHKTSLQTLSSIFTSVLAQRRAHGQITSTPTFKPPPRVTLTDTKRETWLRDLANPSISLRRLSRTIPHGIRGKILLEQCLSKKIPTERAVWLAKCVGANEIRAFKRKGPGTGTFALGGEAKWIRDWTAFVEQFVESIIASCGENEWKTKIQYAVRLSAHLYSEHLLDREHYLDWLSSSLETSTLAKVPMWLLITQVHWDDLLKYRRHGRRVVTALCGHLQTAHESADRDLLIPIIDRMTFLVSGLMKSRPESFVSPKAWAKHRNTLEACLTAENPLMVPAFSLIDDRNTRLVPSGIQEGQTPRRRLIQLLDTTITSPFTNDLPKQCWEILDDKALLVQTVLQWATSAHRPGLTKLYVGVRFLRLWGRSGLDIDEAIHIFLGSGTNEASLDKASLYHLVSELARSGHFSISKYLQWLISRGGVRGPADVAKDGPCATRLLAEIPTHDLPDSLDRLRRTVLRRAAFSVDDEVQEIEDQLNSMSKCLPRLIVSSEMDCDEDESTGDGKITDDLSQLSRTIKSELGLWLRKHISLHVVQPTVPLADEWKTTSPKGVRSALTSPEFNQVRQTLEKIDDISMLADVLKIVLSSDDLQVLASVSDTLNLHLESFAAIGALKDLFATLLARLQILTAEQDSDPAILIESLCDLAARMPGAEKVFAQLSQELASKNRKTAADACSPVSDYMAEVLLNSESDFSDEIEKVLGSGTSMDSATLERLFHMIVSRMEASWIKDVSTQRSCAMLLTRLRSFDAKQFDSLLSPWLQTFIRNPSRPTSSHVLGPLIATGCLEFKNVLGGSTAFLDIASAKGDVDFSKRIASENLELLLGTSVESDPIFTEDAYRLNICRRQVQRNLTTVVLTVIRQAVELAAFDYDGKGLPPHTSSLLQDLLQRLVLADLDATGQVLVMPLAARPDPKIATRLRSLVGSLLGNIHTSVEGQDIAHRIEMALNIAGDLTLPFCQLELRSIFAIEASEGSNEESASSASLDVFERAVDSAVASENKTWTSIIPMLDPRISHHLCSRAERLFLNILPTYKADTPGKSESVEEDVKKASRMLFIIEHTSSSISPQRSMTSLGPQIIQKLNDMWKILTQSDTTPRLAEATRSKYLPLLLHFINLHIPLSDPTNKPTIEVHARMLLSLSSLLSLPYRSLFTATPTPITSTTSSTYTITISTSLLDTSLHLIDTLPAATRQSCIRALKSSTSHAQHNPPSPVLCYIFSIVKSDTDWLHLCQKRNGLVTVPFQLRRWETLSEPTPVIGENDTSLSLTLFAARKS